MGKKDGKKILVVDDDSNVLRFAQFILERNGYHVLTAGDGLEALELFEEHKTDIALVVLDMIMPLMSGERVFQTLCATSPKLPVLISSGCCDAAALARIRTYGSFEFLPKPYPCSKLVTTIERMLNVAR
jgi:DNA-binding NtrC family response regulator